VALDRVLAILLEVDEIVEQVDRAAQQAERRERAAPRADPSARSPMRFANTTGARTNRFFTHWCGRTAFKMDPSIAMAQPSVT
jgi:hypothetical protein